MVIAGSPRNKFKFSVSFKSIEVEHFTVGLSPAKKTTNAMLITGKQLDCER